MDQFQLYPRISFKFILCIITFTLCINYGICSTHPYMGTETSLRQNLEDLFNNTLEFTDDNLPYENDELSDTTPKNNSEYDFIVIGAGSAGATIASRLSEITSVTVLLIEAGGKEYSIVDIPSSASTTPSTKAIDWNYETERSNKYCLASNGTCGWPRAKIMGGCSSHNGMVATRGNRRDYDEWADETGDDSWSYQNMLKYFEKLENFKNNSGPVPIRGIRHRVEIAKSFVEAAEEVGFSEFEYAGPVQAGFTYFPTTSCEGERWSANRAYLRPAKNRTNLILTQHSHVHKILIDNVTKSAYGVRYSKNGQIYEVKASKEIILSAGVINSPQILMLSGIGPKNHLLDLNIAVVKDGPVGENLIDHVEYGRFLTFYVNDSSAIEPRNVLDPNDDSIRNYMYNRSGILSYGYGMNAVALFNADNLTSSEPNIEIMYSAGITSGTNESTATRHTYAMIPLLLRPRSRGRIILRSDNPVDKPEIYPNYFEDPDDVRLMIKGIRMVLRTGETNALKRHGSEFQEFSSVCDVHGKGSDDYWECELREQTATAFHPVGSCKMGRENSSSAVLDSKLKVIGVKGLRVADASIMPNIISGHLNIPVIAIAEKAADMIKIEYGY